MGLKSQVIESVRWLAMAQLVSQLVRIVVSIYVIRQLENEQMAYVALADTLLGFLDMFATLGLGAVIISKKDLTEREISNIAGVLLIINFSITLLVILLAAPVASFYRIVELEDILKVVCLGFLLTGVSAPCAALLSRNMRFKEQSIIQFAASVVGALTSFILVNVGFEYWSIVLGGLAYHLVKAIAVIHLNGGMVVPRFAIRESSRHISFGGFVMISGVIWYIYTYADVAIAGRNWTPELLGIYAVAIQLTVMPLNRLLPLLKRVALPAFSQTMASDKEKLQHYMVKAQRTAMAICMSFYLGISAIAELLVPIILGPQWAASSLPLMCLCFAAPFRVYLELFEPAIIAFGKPQYLALNSSLIAVVMITFFTLASSLTESTLVLASVWMLVFPILSLAVSRNYCKVMEIRFTAIVATLIKPLIFSLLMWATVRGVIALLKGNLPDVVLLATAIATGVLIFGSICFLFDRKLLSELLELVKSRKRIGGE